MKMRSSLVITDIDGCLTDYPKVFLSWVAQSTGRSYDSLQALKAAVSPQDYEAIKHSYRTSGVKRRLPVCPGAKDTLDALRKNGMRIWIVTTRPRWEPVYSDTLYWVKANCLPYDELLFVDSKEAFARQVPENQTTIVIDDDCKVAEYVGRNPNARVLILNPNMQHQNVVDADRIVVVTHWKEIQDYLRKNFLIQARAWPTEAASELPDNRWKP